MVRVDSGTLVSQADFEEFYELLESRFKECGLSYVRFLSIRDRELYSRQERYDIRAWKEAFFDWKRNEARSPSGPHKIRVPKGKKLYFLAPHYFQKHRRDVDNYLNTRGVFFIHVNKVSVLTLDEITDEDAEANGFDEARKLQGIMVTLAKKPTIDTLYTLFWHDPETSKHAFEQAQKGSIRLEACLHEA